MWIETIPLILAAIVALVGVGLVADAVLADGNFVPVERRRRARAERHRAGEFVVGVGVLCLAAALWGRDVWRYGNVAVLIGAVLVLVGAVMNGRYLGELFSFRGPARRMPPGSRPPAAPAPDAGDDDDAPRMRIR